MPLVRKNSIGLGMHSALIRGLIRLNTGARLKSRTLVFKKCSIRMQAVTLNHRSDI